MNIFIHVYLHNHPDYINRMKSYLATIYIPPHISPKYVYHKFTSDLSLSEDQITFTTNELPSQEILEHDPHCILRFVLTILGSNMP